MDAQVLDDIDRIISSHVGPQPEHRFPGAVVLVARHGVIVKHTAYGHAQTYDESDRLEAFRPMTTDTIFDVASITKVGATTAAMMRLVDEGRVDIDAPVARYIPRFAGEGKEDVTVRHLLTHRSGMWEWQPTYLHADNRGDAINFVIDLDLRYPVGEQRRYSDLGFILLGEIIERATAERIDDYVERDVYSRLGMSDTGYLPAPQLRPRIAATSFGNPFEYEMIKTGQPYPVEGDPDDFDGWRDYTLVGEVNDGNAFYAFEGVSGHAGVFSTAYDLAIYGQTILNRGGYDTKRLASATVVQQFTSDQYDRGQGLGFWTARLSPVEGAGAGGIGHGGFTGTEFMVDSKRELIVVMLTNRQHPDRPYDSVFPAWRSVLEKVVDAAR